ncbi:uncharacterized protein A4U43_C10F18680 [Asparagus officinalis]|uniref:Uncharacterized protein n=1 Tax=Asparagus officinalis TaxID=4686 RepID=A0A5P1E5N7_ASPOF|nr:uncharacterized protein A4U43_C10F18680 [Asparagus officinalis]
MVFTQYWSVKVKPGEPCRVDPGRRRRIMVTQVRSALDLPTAVRLLGNNDDDSIARVSLV